MFYSECIPVSSAFKPGQEHSSRKIQAAKEVPKAFAHHAGQQTNWLHLQGLACQE